QIITQYTKTDTTSATSLHDAMPICQRSDLAAATIPAAYGATPAAAPRSAAFAVSMRSGGWSATGLAAPVTGRADAMPGKSRQDSRRLRPHRSQQRPLAQGASGAPGCER